MPTIPKFPDIPDQEHTPLIAQLLEVFHYQVETVQMLKDEIAVLKGNKPKPKIKPGEMEKEEGDKKPFIVQGLNNVLRMN